jgi:Ca-activated chloride channel family protein
MKRFLAFAIVVACVVGTRGAAAGQQPVFRGVSDAVRLFVTVTDGDGRLVTTLTRDQFEVRDEGKTQPITLFDNTPQPIQLIVMLDVSGSMEGNLPLLRAATEQLYARLRRDDRMRIGTFGRDVVIGPWMTRNGDEAVRHELPDAIAPDALTPLWRAIDQAMDAFGEADDTRRVILVLSDGKDSGPLFRQRVVSQVEVIDRARRDDVMIYGIGMRSRGARPMPAIGPGGLQAALTADLPDPGLARVAEEAGGGYLEIRFGQDLGAAFARVADELHSQYLIGFNPPKRDGKVHEIDIRLTQRGLKARGRKSYTAPK